MKSTNKDTFAITFYSKNKYLVDRRAKIGGTIMQMHDSHLELRYLLTTTGALHTKKTHRRSAIDMLGVHLQHRSQHLVKSSQASCLRRNHFLGVALAGPAITLEDCPRRRIKLYTFMDQKDNFNVKKIRFAILSAFPGQRTWCLFDGVGTLRIRIAAPPSKSLFLAGQHIRP